MGVSRLPSACGPTCNHSDTCFPCTLPTPTHSWRRRGTLVAPTPTPPIQSPCSLNAGAVSPILQAACPAESPWSLNACAVSPILQSVYETNSPCSLNASAMSPIPASKARNVGRGELYVDARKFNPGFSTQALFIPTPKYKSPHDTMPSYKSPHDTMPSYGETVFSPEVSDEYDSGYVDNSDVSEDADYDGPCVRGEGWLSELSTCLGNTQKSSVRPKVRAPKDVPSDTAILEALAAEVSLLLFFRNISCRSTYTNHVSFVILSMIMIGVFVQVWSLRMA